MEIRKLYHGYIYSYLLFNNSDLDTSTFTIIYKFYQLTYFLQPDRKNALEKAIRTLVTDSGSIRDETDILEEQRAY